MHGFVKVLRMCLLYQEYGGFVNTIPTATKIFLQFQTKKSLSFHFFTSYVLLSFGNTEYKRNSKEHLTLILR